MRRTLSAFLCTVACSGAFAIELAAYPKVFSGPEGAEVVLAPTADGKAALFRISGVDHPVDKVVFLGESQRWGGGTDAFVTTCDGRDSAMVQEKGSASGGGGHHVAYLPGREQELALAYDEKKSKALKPAELVAAYEQQKQRGVQAKLAAFDRDKSLAYSRERLADADAGASAACGVPVKTTVDWSAIGDDRLKALSVHSSCGAVASNLERLCRDDAGAFKRKAAALNRIDCRFGPGLRARVADRKVVFTTEAGAPNQDDFIREFLRNR